MATLDNGPPEQTQNKLVCTVGLPRSGKSTWAKEQMSIHGVPIVNPDAVRWAVYGQRFWWDGEALVWAHVWIMVKSLFLCGHTDVILDATHFKKEYRNEAVRQGRNQTAPWKCEFKMFNTPLEECLRRAEHDAVIVPVINRMNNQFEGLDKDETVFKGFGI